MSPPRETWLGRTAALPWSAESLGAALRRVVLGSRPGVRGSDRLAPGLAADRTEPTVSHAASVTMVRTSRASLTFSGWPRATSHPRSGFIIEGVTASSPDPGSVRDEDVDSDHRLPPKNDGRYTMRGRQTILW